MTSLRMMIASSRRAWVLCLSLSTEFFVWLFEFNVCSLGDRWRSLSLELHRVCANIRSVCRVRGSVICQCLTFLSLILVCQHGV
jgi:hypothetical protein